MTGVDIDARPAGLSAAGRVGRALAIPLRWPAGYLDGRDFEATIGEYTVAPAIAGDTMTITLTAEQTTALGARAHELVLTDITGGLNHDDLLVLVHLSARSAPVPDATAEVVINNVTVDVSVVTVELPGVSEAQMTAAVAAEATARAAADTTLQTNITAEATERASAIAALSGTYDPLGAATAAQAAAATDATSKANAAQAAAITASQPASARLTTLAGRTDATEAAALRAAALDAVYQPIGDATLLSGDTSTGRTYSEGAATALTIPTYEGSGEATHPSVVFVPSGWNGYRYWMAMTPYPSANADYENPSILQSNDGETWTVPSGLTNPIEADPGGSNINSDTHLVLSPDGLTMYCFWRQYRPGDAGAEELIYYRSSTDGFTWGGKTLSLSNAQATRRIVSPAVVYDRARAKWLMWGVDFVASPNNVVYMEADAPSGPWSAPTVCTGISFPAGREAWHIDVQQVGGEYVALINDTASGVTGGGGSLFRFTSRNGTAWTTLSTTLPAMAGVAGRWDSLLYRSCFVPAMINGRVGMEVWYSASTPAWKIGRTIIEVGKDAPNVFLGEAAKKIYPYTFGDVVDRADSAVSPGTASSGQAYTVSAGTAGVASNQLYAVAAANTRVYAETSLADGEFGLQLSAVDAASSQWLVVRLVDGSNYLRFGWQSGTYRIEKVVSGSATTLSNKTQTAAANDRLKAVLSGSSLKFYVNDILVGAVTDSANSTGTKMGFQCATTTPRFRSLYAKP